MSRTKAVSKDCLLQTIQRVIYPLGVLQGKGCEKLLKIAIITTPTTCVCV